MPLVLAVGLEEVSAVGGAGLAGGFLVEARGPVGGARSPAGFEGGLRERGGLEDRGGVRVRVRAEVWSLRGERERERRDGGSSASKCQPWVPFSFERSAPTSPRPVLISTPAPFPILPISHPISLSIFMPSPSSFP